MYNCWFNANKHERANVNLNIMVLSEHNVGN